MAVAKKGVRTTFLCVLPLKSDLTFYRSTLKTAHSGFLPPSKNACTVLLNITGSGFTRMICQALWKAGPVFYLLMNSNLLAFPSRLLYTAQIRITLNAVVAL
jgi:hypothetical protein